MIDLGNSVGYTKKLSILPHIFYNRTFVQYKFGSVRKSFGQANCNGTGIFHTPGLCINHSFLIAPCS